MTSYATLFGFGLFDISNRKYRAYLDRFVKFVNKNKIDVVVLCGGHTNVKRPKESEAGTMARYLRPRLKKKVKICIESDSLTTEQNIRFSKRFIDFSEGNKIFVVSDSVRFFKIFWMVLHHWYRLSKSEIIGEWFLILKQAYENPTKKSAIIRTNEIKKMLRYRNFEIVVDRQHSDYKNGLHTIISELFEIEGLYDRRTYKMFMEMTRKKFKMT